MIVEPRDLQPYLGEMRQGTIADKQAQEADHSTQLPVAGKTPRGQALPLGLWSDEVGKKVDASWWYARESELGGASN